MDQMNNVAMAMLKTAAAAAELPKTGKADGDSSDFQKLMEKAQSGQPDSQVEERSAASKPASAAKKDKAPAQKTEEDPIEASKRMQVYLAPVPQEELSRYPAEWLPQVEEGEPIVCIGVRTGENGEQIPILVGAKTAEQMYGRQIVAPGQVMDVSDPEADAILEATAPGADNSPAAMLEKVTAEQFGQEVKQAAQEVRPQQEDDGLEAQITDREQAPQPVFHDVKAAPIKVGEVYDAQESEKADVAQQIDTGLAQALEKGESMVRIQLNPENLGSVTVEISQSADGMLRVALSAHSSETRGLLERHAGDLQGLLSSRTQQTVEVNVQRQQESQQGQDQHPYDGRNGHGQGGQEQRRPRREHADSQDFMQQLRLGLIPGDADL